MVLIIVSVVIGLAVLGGLGWLVIRARRGRPIADRADVSGIPDPRPRLEGPSRPTIEPTREIHSHLNVTLEQLAAIIRHNTEEG